MSLPWRVGIIGCGRVAGLGDEPTAEGPVRSHAGAYHRHPHFSLAAAADPDAQRLATFQRSWGIPRGFARLCDLLELELDVISLCSPTALHGEQTAEILQSSNRPKALFLEKPICRTAGELEHLERLGRDTGVIVLVNHTRRFDPAHRLVCQIIRSGMLGEVVGGRGVYYGGWLNNGTHLIDTLRMALPDELEVLAACDAGSGRGSDRNLEVELRAGAAVFHLDAVEESHYQLFEWEIRCAQGRAVACDMGARLFIERACANRFNERLLVPLPVFPLTGLRDSLAHAVNRIEAHLLEHEQPSVLGTDLATASMTMRIVWQAQELAVRPTTQDLITSHVAQR